MAAAKSPQNLGVGLDVGTMNIVAASFVDDNLRTLRIRDAFLVLGSETERMIKNAGVPYVKQDDEIIVLGDRAMEMANMFGQTVRRPLAGGLVSSQEQDAITVLGIMVKSVLQEPKVPGEVCYFSVPAVPVDAPNRDIIYHRGVFDRIIRNLGFTPYASNEAMAVVFSDAGPEQSALAISFGSGMSNIAFAHKGIEGLSFSVGRGGDSIDAGVAQNLGLTPAKVCAIKESEGLLLKPENARVKEALEFYYRNHIEYTLKNIVAYFAANPSKVSVEHPVPLIISGGTAKFQTVNGDRTETFMDLFQQEFQRVRRRFPIPISEIRMASDPLNAVARGLFLQARTEYDE